MALQWFRYPEARVVFFDKGRSARAATLAAGGCWRALEPGAVDGLLGGHGLTWLGPMFDGLDLFGAAEDEVKSVALIRMAPHLTPGEPPRPCLCAFGSPEEEGFTPTMGCELAAFIARVVERMAERWPVLN